MKNITPGFSILCETGLEETKMFYVLENTIKPTRLK